MAGRVLILRNVDNLCQLVQSLNGAGDVELRFDDLVQMASISYKFHHFKDLSYSNLYSTKY
ncbi:MAG: hypothetical protein JSV50_21030 [Desulfobacteraceae bacterium]|nr:MAG: hypothetical protein JSV50_21030 [Desulfobacteraceae bacterium]